jgi:hypothetical protein
MEDDSDNNGSGHSSGDKNEEVKGENIDERKQFLEAEFEEGEEEGEP